MTTTQPYGEFVAETYSTAGYTHDADAIMSIRSPGSVFEL